MCGIVGWINFNGEDVNKDTLIRMRDILTHRGPDDGGVFMDGPIGLAHRRLSIIDLSPAAHQPMSNEDGTIWVIANGAIYNYVELTEELLKKGHIFKSKSDTEVIIHSYEEKGIDCLHHLNGMFAFALYDKNRNTVFVVRDRIGIKPLYFLVSKDRFLFASEIKALLISGVTEAIPDYTSLRDYLTFEYAIGDQTLFKDIKKLPPGHYIQIREKDYEVKSYWHLHFENQKEYKQDEFINDLQKLLFDSVTLRLRSDVSVGCYLSGGIDSSAVSSIAARVNDGPFPSFTGRFADGQAFDESTYARLVASSSGFDCHEIVISADGFPEIMEKLVWYMDEPTVGPGIYSQYLVSRQAGKVVKVVLGGQGGDELFMGYHRYIRCYLEHMVAKALTGGVLLRRLPQLLAAALCQLSAREMAIFVGFRLFDEFPARYFHLLNQMGRNTKYFTKDFLRSVDSDEQFERFLAAFTDRGESVDLLNMMFYFDLRFYLPALLQVEDRVNMAVSIESRLPLLDYRIVELVARIPASWKIGHFERKYLFKRAVSGIVPQAILDRRDKVGFNTPFSLWVEGPLKDYVRDQLTAKRFTNLGIMNKDRVDDILANPRRNSELIWNLLNLSLWSQTFLSRPIKQ